MLLNPSNSNQLVNESSIDLQTKHSSPNQKFVPFKSPIEHIKVDNPTNAHVNNYKDQFTYEGQSPKDDVFSPRKKSKNKHSSNNDVSASQDFILCKNGKESRIKVTDAKVIEL